MLMPRILYGMYWAVGVAVQTSSAGSFWILQKWDKAPNHLCWHVAHLWPGRKLPPGVMSCPGTPQELGWEKHFHGCSLKLMQFYSLYFCCCLGLVHEWDFTGQFKYEMWNMGKLYPLPSPWGRAQGRTLHRAWLTGGISQVSLRLWDNSVGCFGGWGTCEEYPLCLGVGLTRSCLWGATPGRGIFRIPVVWDGQKCHCALPQQITQVFAVRQRRAFEQHFIGLLVLDAAPTDFCMWDSLVKLFSIFPANCDYLLYQSWVYFFANISFYSLSLIHPLKIITEIDKAIVKLLKYWVWPVRVGFLASIHSSVLKTKLLWSYLGWLTKK